MASVPEDNPDDSTCGAAEGQTLAGRRVLVTGAGRRVGAAIARTLGGAGMHVGVHYNRSRSGAEATCDAIRAAGGQASLFQADLYDRAATRDLAHSVVAELGGLDMLVASAANFDRVPLAEVDDRTWDRALDLNLTAPFLLAQSLCESLRKARGNIVFITCTSVRRPYRDYLPYQVSKAAVRQMMRVLALELAPEVRVNAVAPGTVLPPEAMDEQTLDRLRAGIPLGRIGDAADVARAVCYLACSDFVTGQELVVDGGHTT